tara:strand:+ start:115 stop:1389 length:1275 start_codon:yes stop_codon:yes gene_type:complete
MKSFQQFLSEAPRTSRAVEQARRLGFVSDGHGNWYDREGNYKGHTEKGELILAKKRGPGKEDAPAKQKAAQAQPVQQTKQPQVQGGATGMPASGDGGEGEKEDKGTMTVAFGRFNPPTVGHEKLMNAAKAAAKGGDYGIYPSRTQDDKKNPLSPDEKISFMRQLYPKHGERIINDGEMKTIFNVLKSANEKGYSSINIMVGADRQAEFEKLALKYNGELYDFEDINVVSAGDRDPDADGIEGMSASKLRKAAAEDDFKTWLSGMPSKVDEKLAKNIFNSVKRKVAADKAASKIDTSAKALRVNEGLWQIAPKLDWDGLRENFFLKKVFNIGDLVENLNTGLRGRIVRRGTNYLISVTEDNMMFKSWIGDVSEAYTEVKMDRRMRDKTHPNNLVGTVGYFKNVEAKTPGATVKTFKNFLNKYRKN